MSYYSGLRDFFGRKIQLRTHLGGTYFPTFYPTCIGSICRRALRRWQRTSGVQSSYQHLIDKVIPVYFRGGSNTASAASRMSQIFIFDSNLSSKSSGHILDKIARRNIHVGGTSGGRGSSPLPYIAILADLGQPQPFSVTFLKEVGDPCMLIYAAGVDAMTCPFLAKNDSVMSSILLSKSSCPCSRYLKHKRFSGDTWAPRLDSVAPRCQSTYIQNTEKVSLICNMNPRRDDTDIADRDFDLEKPLWTNACCVHFRFEVCRIFSNLTGTLVDVGRVSSACRSP